MFRNIQARLGIIKGSKYHPCFNIKPEKECKGLVFFMHGLGDTGMGWTETFALQAHDHPNVRYVFPSANMMPVSLNFGMEMPSWFDIKELSENIEDRYDMAQLEESSQNIISIIDSILEEENLTRNELVIGGFSQGGALAFNIALKHYTEVAGILAMSTFLPVDKNSREWLDRLEAGGSLPGPISQHHGDIDPMVRIENAQRGAEILKKFAKDGEFEFHTYRGLEHSSCPEEMGNVDHFISKVLKL